MAAYNHLREKEGTASDTSKNNERQRERQGERKIGEDGDEKMEWRNRDCKVTSRTRDAMEGNRRRVLAQSVGSTLSLVKLIAT